MIKTESGAGRWKSSAKFFQAKIITDGTFRFFMHSRNDFEFLDINEINLCQDQ